MIELMEMIAMGVVLAVLGATLGSFAAAQVWRLRAVQLDEDLRDGEAVNRCELARLKPLLGRKLQRDRSECLECHHTLAWYDLLPVVSWVSLAGRCRYCKKPIGVTEFIAEVGLAAVFVLSYLAWPIALTGGLPSLLGFVIWLVACVLMTILFIYDAKWQLLPFRINIALVVLGGLFVVQRVITTGITPEALGSLGLAVIILGGLYFLFALFRWSGMGDAILGFGLALFLGSWQLAFLALFLANLFGTVMLIPLMMQKRLTRGVHISLGPFLILGALVSMLWGNQIIEAFFAWSSHSMLLLMV